MGFRDNMLWAPFCGLLLYERALKTKTRKASHRAAKFVEGLLGFLLGAWAFRGLHFKRFSQFRLRGL